MIVSPNSDVEEQLVSFIRERFLSGDDAHELDIDTPLLEWGIIDSLKVAILLNFIRDDLGVDVPFERIRSRDFTDIRSIAALVGELNAPDATGPPTNLPPARVE